MKVEESQRSKLVNGGIVIVVIIVGLFVFAFFPFRSNTAVKVFYQGQTNYATGGVFAVLAATNESDQDTTIYPLDTQLQTRGVWSKLVFNYESSFALPAHSFSTITMPIPTNCNSWRMPFVWGYAKSLPIESFRELLRENLEANWRRITQGSGPRFLNVYHTEYHLDYSQAVTNK